MPIMPTRAGDDAASDWSGTTLAMGSDQHVEDVGENVDENGGEVGAVEAGDAMEEEECASGAEADRCASCAGAEKRASGAEAEECAADKEEKEEENAEAEAEDGYDIAEGEAEDGYDIAEAEAEDPLMMLLIAEGWAEDGYDIAEAEAEDGYVIAEAEAEDGGDTAEAEAAVDDSDAMGSDSSSEVMIVDAADARKGITYTVYTKDEVVSVLGGEAQFAMAVEEGSIYTVQIGGVEFWTFV